MTLKSLSRIFSAILLAVLLTLGLSQSGMDPQLPGADELSTQAYNTCTAYNCDRVLLDTVAVHSNGNIYFEVSGVETALSCSPVAGRWIAVNQSQNNYKEMYTALLANQLAGKRVNVFLDTSSATCQVLFISSKL